MYAGTEHCLLLLLLLLHCIIIHNGKCYIISALLITVQNTLTASLSYSVISQTLIYVLTLSSSSFLSSFTHPCVLPKPHFDVSFRVVPSSWPKQIILTSHTAKRTTEACGGEPPRVPLLRALALSVFFYATRLLRLEYCVFLLQGMCRFNCKSL